MHKKLRTFPILAVILGYPGNVSMIGKRPISNMAKRDLLTANPVLETLLCVFLRTSKKNPLSKKDLPFRLIANFLVFRAVP